MVCSEKRRLKGAFIGGYSFFKAGKRWAGADLSWVTSNGTGEYGMKLCQGKFRLDIRKRFFTEKVLISGTDSMGK